MNSSSSWHNLRSDSEALACASSTSCCISSRSSRAALFIPVFAVFLFQSFPESAFVTVFNFGVVSHTFRQGENFGFSFRTFLATFGQGVFLFISFTSVSGSSTLWEIAFQFARGFELFHLSHEPCPASSTASWISSFSPLMTNRRAFGHRACECGNVFLTFDTGFRLGEDEDGDVETRIMTLETKGATTFRDSLHLHPSERSSPLSSSYGGRTGHSSNPHLFISLLTSQSFSGDLYKGAPTDLNRHIPGVCDPPKDNVNVASFAVFFTFVVFRDLIKSCRRRRTTAFSTGQRRELRCRNSEPPKPLFPGWRC